MRSTAAWIGVLAGIAAAQAPVVERSPAPFEVPSLSRNTGVDDVDGRLVGTGPDYQAVFSSAGMVFTPFFGSAAPHDLPVRFAFTEATRDRDRVEGSDGDRAARPTMDRGHRTIAYDRGRCVETYEMRLDGVKQSFTFDRLPGGQGDLVVRGRLETDLPVRTVRDDLVAFWRHGVGGVTIDGVLGFDAGGTRCAGSLRFDGETLEMRLPASFVENARLPLTLDPLFGVGFDTDTTSNDLDNERPDIAYDATHDVFLVAFERRTSALATSVVAQRISGSDGSLVGANTTLQISQIGNGNVKCANVRVAERFVVAWFEVGGLHAKTVRAVSGVPGTLRLVRNHPAGGFARDLDLGGEATLADDEAILVWENSVTGEIEARQLRAVVDDTVALNGGIVVVSGGDTATDDDPAISKSGGASGRHMIVWHREQNGRNTIQAKVFNRNLVEIDGFLPITSTSDEHFNPGVDGDGDSWVVAYEVDEENVPGDRTIACRGVTLNNISTPSGITRLQPEVQLPTGFGDVDRNPEVCHLGQSALVLYEDEGTNPSEFDVRYWNVDPLTCESCEGSGVVEFGFASDSSWPSAASKNSGDPELRSSFAVIAWESSVVSTGNGDARARGFLADLDGVAEDLGGDCGGGGVCYATCARVGNGDFQQYYNSGFVNAPAVMVLSPFRIDAACGPCTLVPDPFAGFVHAATTDALGYASLTTPISSSSALAGLQFFVQWAVMPTGAASCGPLGMDLSNALRVVIED